MLAALRSRAGATLTSARPLLGFLRPVTSAASSAKKQGLLELEEIEKILSDVKADDVRVIPVGDQCDWTDYMVVATGRSTWHVRNIAQAIIHKVKQKQKNAQRLMLPSVEGHGGGKWIVIDSGCVIVHALEEKARAYYNLESLWTTEMSPKGPNLANPNLRKWRNTPVNNYDKLQELFSKDRATGSMANTYNEYVKILRTDIEDQDVVASAEHEIPHEDVDESIPVDQPSPHPTTSTFDEGTSNKSGKRRRQPQFENVAMTTLVNNSKKLDDIVTCMQVTNQSIDTFLKGDTKINTTADKVLLEELKKIGVPRSRRAVTYVTLGSNKDKARLFYSAPEELRLEVLNAMMEGN